MTVLDGQLAETQARAKELEQSLASLERVGDRFAARMIDAFEAVAIKGKSLDGVLQSLALSVSDMALDAALKPFEQALGGLFGQGLSGLAGPSPAGAGPLHINFNVQTPNADSFRQSQGQIAAMLSRTVGAGQRNL